MQANIASGLTAWEFADGATVECTAAVLEELRRLAVEGFVAFGHGGLEVGGVLYGVREGDRLSIRAFAELRCEHALGPAFALSDTDRQVLGRLLQAPAGLQCVGWYRSHTRSGLDLDATDRDRFEQFFADATSAGLVLKPTHWGPSAAAFYARRTNGEVLASSPRDFTIDPLNKKPGETEEPVLPEAPPELAGIPASRLPAAWGDTMPWPDAAAFEAAGSSPRFRAWRRSAALFLVATAILAVYYLGWLRQARQLALQVYATSPGQVRIDWDHNSLPVVKAEYGRLEIHDGNSEKTIPLDRSQLQFSTIDYVQRSSRITVSLRIKPRGDAAAVEESVEFVGRPEPPPPVAEAIIPASSLLPPQPKIEESSPVSMAGDLSAPAKELAAPAVSPAPKRRFYMPPRPLTTTAGGTVDLPAAPPVPAATNVLPSLPEILPLPEPPVALLKPEKSVSPATPKPFTGPRSGRLIWTGELGRRTVIEIDGQHASIGSLSGSLSTGAAEYRVSPAEFTRDGFTVYTTDGASNGRIEAPSKENGWNSVHFVYDPVRAAELVVLERPSRINNFSRLVFRNDGRNCQVVLVDWTAYPEPRN